MTDPEQRAEEAAERAEEAAQRAEKAAEVVEENVVRGGEGPGGIHEE